MPDQKIKSLRDFIEKRVCNYCCYDGGLCAECKLLHEIVHVEQVNSLNLLAHNLR